MNAIRLMSKVLGSFGFACVLLFFLFLLTLFGTFDQVEFGLYDVQKRYFESWWVLANVPYLPFKLPLPGGVLCMGLLALNLLVGGLVRIRWSTRTAGVIVIHIGMALMLAAGYVKFQHSDEGNVRLYEGQEADEYQSYHRWEVAVFDAIDRFDVQEHLVPQEYFKDLTGESKRLCRMEKLPFDLEFSNYERNAEVLPKGPNWDSGLPVIDGFSVLPKEVEVENEMNAAALYVKAIDKATGEETSGILYGFDYAPWTVKSGGRTWAVDLRHERYSLPFTLRLDDFEKTEHPGTRIPKTFASDVTKVEAGGERSLRIEMNEPLRDEGVVLFQASWGPQNAPANTPLFSVFAVHRNPSDYWPLYSCIIISIGLLMTFAQKLTRYVRNQTTARRVKTQS